jgi:hypothetical protein
MKTSSIVTTISFASALLLAPLAFAQEAPGAPMGEAQAPAGVPPPGASERGVGRGQPQPPGVEQSPEELRGQHPETHAPQRDEMVKPPVPNPLLPEDEESE